MKEAKLYISPTKGEIPTVLYPIIHKSFQSALRSSDEQQQEDAKFYIALSGGSLPSLLANLPRSFLDANIDPQWDRWHVILADERLVPSSHPDSNLKALRESFLDQVPIPKEQIYGIDESLLSSNSEDGHGKQRQRHAEVAEEYENRVFYRGSGTDEVQNKNKNTSVMLHCVLLGFGPDGHTASLFPNHDLLQERTLLVAGICDSPKPPPERITLTQKVFEDISQTVIFVGAGESKAPILNDIFERVHLTNNDNDNDNGGECKQCVVEMKDISEQRYPCGMIRPRGGGLMYITDSAGGNDLVFTQNCCSLL